MPSYLLQVLTTRPLPANEVLSLKSRCPLHSAGLRPNVKLWPNSPLIKLDRASVPSLNKLNFEQVFLFWVVRPLPVRSSAPSWLRNSAHASTLCAQHCLPGPILFCAHKAHFMLIRPWCPFVLHWWFYITSELDLLLNITLVHEIINFYSVTASCMIHQTPLFFGFHLARLPHP